jgi:hypothetical protein
VPFISKAPNKLGNASPAFAQMTFHKRGCILGFLRPHIYCPRTIQSTFRASEALLVPRLALPCVGRRAWSNRIGSGMEVLMNYRPSAT